jgi:mRNA-degrading endonuclease RelE of RelBE toxin-antitoxin system
MKYSIIKTNHFIERFDKIIPREIKSYFTSQMQKLENNPFGIGKALKYDFFRELKHGKYRLYYIIYEEKVMVVMVDVSNKKTQQNVIDRIIEEFKNYSKSKI